MQIVSNGDTLHNISNPAFWKKCELSPMETTCICMQYQILFSGKNKKNTTDLSSAELAQRVVQVNADYHRAKTQDSIYIICSVVSKIVRDLLTFKAPF